MAGSGGGKHFTIIGAGTVGVCTALYLLRDGHSVTMLDREPPGTGCSFGNGGLIQTGLAFRSPRRVSCVRFLGC